jgi:PAS domain S-box-containing protein
MTTLSHDKNRRILIIDDNRAIHDDFRKILSPAAASAAALDATEMAVFGRPTGAVQQTQFEVDSAYQGQEGVLLVKNALEAGRPYAMAFVDVRMPPGWDGVETTLKIWELDPGLQVVLCTAYSDYSWGEMFEKLGHHDGLLILKKPFDTVEAFQLAHALTEKWWLHRQSLRKMEELESMVGQRTADLTAANKALSERTALASLSSNVSGELIRHDTLHEMLQGSAEAIVCQLDAAFARIWTLNEKENMLELRASAGMYTHIDGPHSRVPVGKFKIGLIAQEREPHLTNSVVGDPRVGDRAWARRENMVAFAGYPLLVNDRLLGVVAMFARHELTDFVMKGLGSVANQIAIGIERKQAENALRESNEKFHQLADNITDAFWICSPDLREVHYVSRAFERIWGRSVESVYANPLQWVDFILPEDRDRVLGAFAALTGDAPGLDIEHRIVRPGGEIRWVRVRGFQVRDGSNKLIRHTGIVTDITEWQRAAEELLGSERRFSDMLRNLELVSVMIDLDARITYCNDYLLRLTGWKREEVMGGDWFELFLPPELFKELRRVHSALLDDQPAAWHYENEIVTRSGARRLIRWNNSVLRSASGDVIGTASIGEDITERRQAEEALKSSEARKNAIVQSSIDCIITMDHEGKILEFNPAAEKVFGHARAEVMGRELAEVIIPPPLRERHREGMMHYLATGESKVLGKRIEITAIRSDGSEFPVELAITRMGVEKPPTFTGFIRDISERKRAERQLNIQYAISRVLAESSTAEQATPKILQAVCDNFGWDVGGLWSVDSREGVLRCVEIWSAPNVSIDEFKATSRQMTFARNVGLPGRVWASGQPAWIADLVQDGNFPSALVAKQAGLHAAFAFPILISSGVNGVIEILSREVREPDEDLLRTFAVLGSQLGQFFQRRQVEDQLFQSQKMETVGKLAGGVAHEFNSILTAIIGQSELLLGDLPAGSPLAENATEISRAADRAATLTRQLLAYGRKQMLQPEVLDLNSVLAGMESTLRHLMGRGADVCIALAPGLKAVKADAGQIEQVIMNIAMNAVDAMPNGGKLTLETANVTLDQEYVSRFPELKAGEYVMLAITDTGTGMSEAVQARVFEPFFSTKGVGQGTGLGLATCHGIINQSGGHITIYSELARGATFKIYLPQAEQQAAIPIRRLDSPDLPRGTETILLVEDDPALREMAASLLRRLGYTVLAAANGIEALSLKKQRDSGHIDLLFTDVVMPHMSGRELAQRLSGARPQMKVLYVSGYTDDTVVRHGVLAADTTLIQKPYTHSILARKVREILDSRPAGGRASSPAPASVPFVAEVTAAAG